MFVLGCNDTHGFRHPRLVEYDSDDSARRDNERDAAVLISPRCRGRDRELRCDVRPRGDIIVCPITLLEHEEEASIIPMKINYLECGAICAPRSSAFSLSFRYEQ